MLKASITRKKHKTYIKIQTFKSKTVKIKLSKLNIKKNKIKRQKIILSKTDYVALQLFFDADTNKWYEIP